MRDRDPQGALSQAPQRLQSPRPRQRAFLCSRPEGRDAGTQGGRFAPAPRGEPFGKASKGRRRGSSGAGLYATVMPGLTTRNTFMTVVTPTSTLEAPLLAAALIAPDTTFLLFLLPVYGLLIALWHRVGRLEGKMCKNERND